MNLYGQNREIFKENINNFLYHSVLEPWLIVSIIRHEAIITNLHLDKNIDLQ